MAITATWDESAPTNATDIRDVDDAIVADKTAVRERMRNGGHIWETTFPSTDQEAGRHACNVEFASGGSGAVAHEWYVYDTDGSTKIATFKGSAHATPGLALVGKITATTLDTTGAVTFAGLITGSAGLTVSSGAVTLPAGSISQAALAANAATGASQNFGGTHSGALGSNQVLVTQAYTPGTIPGPVLVFFTMRHTNNSTGGNFSLQAQVERTAGSGTWTNLSGPYAQVWSGGPSEHRTLCGVIYDALGTSNSASVNYRMIANHLSLTNNYAFNDIGLTILELRR